MSTLCWGTRNKTEKSGAEQKMSNEKYEIHGVLHFYHKLEGFFLPWKSATILKDDGSFWMMIDL